MKLAYLLITTTIISSVLGGVSLGTNRVVSIALGITRTLLGQIPARNTVFSLLVCDTQITPSMSARANSSILFVMIAPKSLNPNKEWSVKNVLIFIILALKIASRANGEKAAWPWTTSISSRMKIFRRIGNVIKRLGRITSLISIQNGT